MTPSAIAWNCSKPQVCNESQDQRGLCRDRYLLYNRNPIETESSTTRDSITSDQIIFCRKGDRSTGGFTFVIQMRPEQPTCRSRNYGSRAWIPDSYVSATGDQRSPPSPTSAG